MRVLMVMCAALLIVSGSASVAAGACCGEKTCCASAACCKGDAACGKHGAAPAAVDSASLPSITPGIEWPEEIAQPTRETAKVLFRHPVRIGDKVLFGMYVIEHDTDRMARGLPCTHIYAANDLRLPVVAFHCRHLDRKPTGTATVTLQRIPAATTPMYRLIEYQFQDSADGHGVPNTR